MEKNKITNYDIVFILPKLGAFGGVENSIYRISKYYQEIGNRVAIVQTEAISSEVPKDFPKDITLFSYIYRSNFFGFFDIYQSVKMALLINKINPKILFISHDRLIPYSFFFINRSIRKIQFLRNDHESVFFRGLLNNKYLTAIITNNKIVFDKLSKKYSISNIYFISNGVDKDLISNIRDKEYDMIFVGRLVDESKGIFSLPDILNAMNNNKFILHIVGEGPDKDKLIEKFKQYGLFNNIIFHGRLSHQKVLEIMSRSRILLFTSYYEGMPNVLLESMASGSVPFVFRLDGVTDFIIRNEENGFVFERGDYLNMSKKILTYLNNDLMLSKVSHNAKEFINKSFSITDEKKKFIKLLSLSPNIYRPLFDASVIKLFYLFILKIIILSYEKSVKIIFKGIYY